ncbi:hypothetical protein ABW21_db0201379 [Orbilia brochopaga]|nr:hypothetical protein ABW21_db0201379 [Drechslerella brochopaga]
MAGARRRASQITRGSLTDEPAIQNCPFSLIPVHDCIPARFEEWLGLYVQTCKRSERRRKPGTELASTRARTGKAKRMTQPGTTAQQAHSRIPRLHIYTLPLVATTQFPYITMHV